jgi:hypothetical protein
MFDNQGETSVPKRLALRKPLVGFMVVCCLLHTHGPLVTAAISGRRRQPQISRPSDSPVTCWTNSGESCVDVVGLPGNDLLAALGKAYVL